MKVKYCCLFLLFLSACHPRDENPELRDAIYLDFKKELALVEKTIESATKELEERRAVLKGVIPQTGQLKTIEKKVFESDDYIERLKQQKQFFTIKIEQRKQLVDSKYKASLRGGPEWPDPKEVSDYESEIKFQRAKIKWDKEKGILKKVPRGTTASDEPKEKPSH